MLLKIQRQSRYLLAWLTTVVTFGITGMRFIIGLSWIDSVYYTIITVSTVGYDAPTGLSGSDKVFLAILVAMSLGTVGYAIGTMSQSFLNRQMMASLGRGADRRIKKMEGHWIICGFGRYGKNVASMLKYEDTPFAIIDSQESIVLEAREGGCCVVKGDATEEDTLEKAGIKRAKGLIITLDSDADTVYVALTARAMNADLRIVARASDARSVGVLEKAGVNRVVNPIIAGSVSLVRASLKPSVADLLDLVVMSRKLDLDFSTITIKHGSSMAEKTLKDLDFRNVYDVTVMAILPSQDEPVYNPKGNQLIREGDQVIVFGEKHRVESLRESLGNVAS